MRCTSRQTRNRISGTVASSRLASALGLALATVLAQSAQAQTFKTLYTFTGGADGSAPETDLLLHGGSLYGTTPTGGTSGLGTIFQLNISTGQLTVLHTFAGAPLDGATSVAGVIRDSAGNLYGTTQIGGSANLGTVYELGATGAMVLLHSFSGSDGSHPVSGLVMDSAGNLYGTCSAGGAGNFGTVFKLGKAGILTTLHNFAGFHSSHDDGATPYTTLLLQKGVLYGTTLDGGNEKDGTVFMVNASTGKESLLYNFPRNLDGSAPTALVTDGKGNLYGTAALEYGAVYMLNVSTRAETTLYTFPQSGAYGLEPEGVIRNSAGNLYGTTYEDGAFGYGTVFMLDTANNLTTLYNFSGGTDGAYPLAGVVQDSEGNLYGSASDLYAGFGTIFEITP